MKPKTVTANSTTIGSSQESNEDIISMILIKLDRN